ncbi:Crp/Fnr family transcriptional regulator [Limnohabitans planktonicus]|uniref:Crp/Fnr family transcriptional regulator n=1 Tax=Limnohabitans planktonicus II-D5 TaxID=1293045 RepID=A0A2T7UD47_9BURK|nr:Crp/Fnr family transcriptional regulator [Limnohabitans planktonicus]PVE42584.1 Crp/Fnr family transcriptional regulator [Limnohabitans planktonicus II-D5]|eukprot:gene4739-4639_t
MLASVSSLTSHPGVTVAAGTVLLHRGDAVDRIVHVRKGRVTLGVLQHGVLEHQLGAVDGPFWLEAASGLLGLTHAVDAVAQTPVELQFISVQDFLAEVNTLPAGTQNLLKDLAKAQRQQTDLAVSRLSKDADARCAEWLLQHAAPQDDSGGLAVTLTERKCTIAAQLGIAPETFSRVLRHLRERQLISGGGRVLCLPNPQALRELAGV